jgi:hypothetical protein
MHENKTKHNLARDTNAWKNPNTTNTSRLDYNTLYKVPLATENVGKPTIPSKLTCTANNKLVFGQRDLSPRRTSLRSVFTKG